MTADHPLAPGVASGDWARAAALLDGAGPVVVVGHVNPDGDALGSALALAMVVERAGRPAAVTWDGAPRLPASLAWLPRLDLVRAAGDLPEHPALVVAVDASSPERLGGLAPLLDRAARVLVVDHHRSGRSYGHVRLADDAAVSTTALVAALLEHAGVDLDADLAACLYVGLVTDTGSFRYAHTTPAALRLGARLMEAGAPAAHIATQVWDSRPFAVVRVQARALDRATLEPAANGGRGLVWTWTTRADLDHTGAGYDDLESIVDVLRATREADVACVLKTAPDGLVHASLRSRAATDVGSVCAALGGGGHRLAAGFTTAADVDAAIEAVRAALQASG